MPYRRLLFFWQPIPVRRTRPFEGNGSITGASTSAVSFRTVISADSDMKSGLSGGSETISLTGASGRVIGLVCRASETVGRSLCEDAGSSGTKSAPVTDDNIQSVYGENLYLTAFREDNSQYIAPQKLIYDGRDHSGQMFWKTATEFAWPETGKLHFWAWAPGSAVVPTVDDADGSLTFDYSTAAPAAASKDAEAQPDVLLAYVAAGRSDSYADRHLKHALASLRFDVSYVREFTVKSITLAGIRSKGVCTFRPDASKPHSWEQIFWSGLSEPVTYVQTVNSSIGESMDGSVQDIGEASATFMIIPQCVDAGTDDVTLDILIERDGEEEHYTAVLAAQEWKSGVTYTYTIQGIGDKLVVSVDDQVEDRQKSGLVIANTDESEVRCYMRAIIMGNWYDDDDRIVASWKVNQGTFDATFPTVVGVASASNWILGEDGYYYYKYPVNPGDVTGQTVTDPDGDPLFVTYDAPASPLVAGSHLIIKIVAQGVKWDEDKEWAAEAWGEAAAGYLSVEDKQ